MVYYENNFRDLFIGVDDYVPLKSENKKVIPINFDNAATTPAFKTVEELVREYLHSYGSIGRGTGIKSCKCTNFYEESRNVILDFFHIKNKENYTVIYVKNTTEGINLLANTLIDGKEDHILTTRMEHHANDLPWRDKGTVLYVEVDKGGKISLEELEEKLIKGKGQIKVVTVTGASNVTGFVNPINKIAEIAHKNGAKIVIDAAQLVAHEPINVEGANDDDYFDFLVFSAHKVYAPFGVGVVVAKKDVLINKKPLLKGGGAVDLVLDEEVFWFGVPQGFEAGTPDFLGVVALIASLNTLKNIGFETIVKKEVELRDYFLKELGKIDKLILYGDKDVTHRLAVIAMNLPGIYHEDLAKKLSDIRAIAVRQGTFCAHPYVHRLLGVTNDKCLEYARNCTLPRPGMIRASLALYNDFSEIDEFLNVIEYIVTTLK
ncbi:MAG: aminotransferase class V-fold PLP-dependent enzyme [Sarcina sp.]